MPSSRDAEVLVKVARMYFQDGVSQQDIAVALGTSRSNVSRMLTAARKQRIVEIKINDPAGRDYDLEEALRLTFDLSDARVSRYVPGSSAVTRAGELAARWLLESLADVRTVALSWGTALQAMVRATMTTEPHQVDIVQLVGGLSPIRSQISGQELVRELAARLGATYGYLHAPALLQSSQAVDALMHEPTVASALEAARSAQVALVGVGTHGSGSSGALVQALGLSRSERAEFEAQRPAGDICARFYNAAGEPLHGAVHDRVLAVTLEDLRRIPTVVGIAAGREKAAGVLGALRGRFIDVLVCDATVARAALGSRTVTG